MRYFLKSVLDPTESWNGLERLGAVLLVMSGVLYIANLGLGLSQGGALPSSGSQLLAFIASRTLMIQAVSVVFFAIDVMLAVGFVSLFLALRGSNKTYAAIGAVLALISLAVDFINTVLLYSLVGLSNSYSASTSDVSRASFASIAEYVGSTTTGIGGSFVFVVFSIAILAISFAMFAGRSWRAPAYLGVIAGVLGITAGLLEFIPLIMLWPVWFIVVGARLFKSTRAANPSV